MPYRSHFVNLKVASCRECFAASRADVFLWSLSGRGDGDGGGRNHRHRVVIGAGGSIHDGCGTNRLHEKIKK